MIFSIPNSIYQPSPPLIFPSTHLFPAQTLTFAAVNYLTVEGLSKIYDTKVLFNGISFSINRGQKVALVARNGAGKSTLLRIIMGKDIADSGKVQVHKSITTGYLEQEPALNENRRLRPLRLMNRRCWIRNMIITTSRQLLWNARMSKWRC